MNTKKEYRSLHVSWTNISRQIDSNASHVTFHARKHLLHIIIQHTYAIILYVYGSKQSTFQLICKFDLLTLGVVRLYSV